jgi:hypothetical protein
MTVNMILGMLKLLTIFLGPFLALALPLTRGSRWGWALFAISCFAVVLNWDAYVGTSDVYFTRGDRVDYNLKKPDFALFVAMSSVTLFSFLYFVIEQKKLGAANAKRLFPTALFLLIFLALPILTYYLTLRVVEHQKWGFGDCEVQIDARGLPSCREDSRGSVK